MIDRLEQLAARRRGSLRDPANKSQARGTDSEREAWERWARSVQSFTFRAFMRLRGYHRPVPTRTLRQWSGTILAVSLLPCSVSDRLCSKSKQNATVAGTRTESCGDIVASRFSGGYMPLPTACPCRQRAARSPQAAAATKRANQESRKPAGCCRGPWAIFGGEDGVPQFISYPVYHVGGIVLLWGNMPCRRCMYRIVGMGDWIDLQYEIERAQSSSRATSFKLRLPQAASRNKACRWVSEQEAVVADASYRCRHVWLTPDSDLQRLG